MSIETIIVNYNAGVTLQSCVQALLDSNEASSVTIVDNASSDHSAEILRDAFADRPNFEVIFNSSNAGFGPAVNLAVRLSKADWILILNPDCIVEQDTLGKLKEALQADQKAALAGPAVRNDTGQIQRATIRRFPDPWKSLMTATGLWRLGKWLPIFHGIEVDVISSGSEPFICEAVSGACMMVRGSAFKAVGLMDDQYAMHCEDLDLMYRLKEQGWHCLYVPQASCIHQQGLSSKSRPTWVHYQKHLGMARFFKKFQADSTFLPLRWLVYTGIWLRFIILWPLILTKH